jgi:hypothetical protein
MTESVYSREWTRHSANEDEFWDAARKYLRSLYRLRDIEGNDCTAETMLAEIIAMALWVMMDEENELHFLNGDKVPLHDDYIGAVGRELAEKLKEVAVKVQADWDR